MVLGKGDRNVISRYTVHSFGNFLITDFTKLGVMT